MMNGHIELSVRRLPHAQGLPLPAYKSAHAAGMDLPAAISEDMKLAPGERRLVPTGFAIAVPNGYEAQIRPRSGLSTKHGITLVNAPGTIDADYRGEIMVALVNLGEAAFTLTRGTRIAQMVVAPVMRCAFNEVDELPHTERGADGFGSTGVKSAFK